jgi:hypothetical protein
MTQAGGALAWKARWTVRPVAFIATERDSRKIVGKTPPTYASFCCVFVHPLDDTFEVLYLLLMSTIPDSIVCSPLQFQT